MNVPTGHGVHALDPGMEFEKPAGHSAHVVEFAEDVNLFASHLLQEGDPTEDWYLPGRHGRHEAAP